jgi:hypothetical protein
VRNEETGEWQEPADNWGELRFKSAAPEAGAEWTDDGQIRDHRHLKSPAGRRMAPGAHRAAADKASACSSPRFRRRPRRAGLLRSPRERAGLDHLPPIVDQGPLDTLSAAEAASPLAGRVYDLRHACVSTWLNGGIPPAQVAEWAGHSVAILLKTYAKCLDGQDAIAKRRIEEALGDPGEDDEDYG